VLAFAALGTAARFRFSAALAELFEAVVMFCWLVHSGMRIEGSSQRGKEGLGRNAC
jgi:hypothetical protein